MNKNIYEIRKSNDPWGVECYFGYKNGRQYTEAYDTLSELLENNCEFTCEFTYMLEILCRAYDENQISKEEFLSNASYYLTAEEKHAFIEGTEFVLDMSADIPISEHELYEYLIKERANELKPANVREDYEEKTKKAVEAWHQLGDAFIEGYEETHGSEKKTKKAVEAWHQLGDAFIEGCGFDTIDNMIAKIDAFIEAYEETHGSPETYTVSYTSDAHNGHKRNTYNSLYNSLDDALEAYVKSRNAAETDDVVMIYDSERRKFIEYSDGNETVFLSNFRNEADKQKVIDASIAKTSIATPDINHGR